MKLITLLLIAFTVQSFSQDTTTSTPLQFMFGATAGLNYEMYGGNISTFADAISCPTFKLGNAIGYELGGVGIVLMGEPNSSAFGFGLCLLYQNNGTLASTTSDQSGCLTNIIYDVKGDSLISYEGIDKYSILKQHTLSYSSSRIVVEPFLIIGITSSLRLSVGPSISYSIKRNYKQTAEILTPDYLFNNDEYMGLTTKDKFWVVANHDGYFHSFSSLTWIGLNIGVNYDFKYGTTIVSPKAKFTYGLSSAGLDGAPYNEVNLTKLFVGCDVFFSH